MREWLKEIRLDKGMTQAKVATNSKISRSHYTHIELGNKNPTVSVAKKIAKELEFDWVKFF